MADENILEQAATATQGMIPGQVQGHQQNLTAFGPSPLVQPPPIPRFQPPPSQGNRPTSFASVGSRKRADKQALFQGIAGFVKSGSDYLNAKKERALSMDINRLMEATQGRTEAQQALQQDPNNQEAKAALEKNTHIINDITSDPKKSKQLQKALNIDLFGDGKNKAENQALIKAWSDFQNKQQEGDKTALNPAAQRLEASQPQRLGLDPEAQAQAQAIKAGLIPKADEILKSNVDIFKAYQTAKTNEDRTAAIKDAAKIRADAEKNHADKIVDAANIRAYGQEKAAEIHSRSQRYVADEVAKTWDKRIESLNAIANNKNLNEKDKTIIGSMSKEADSYVKQIKTYITDNEKMQAELDKKGTTIFGVKISAASDADSKLMRQKIGFNNMAIKMMQKNLDEVQNKMQMMQKMGIITMSGAGEGSGGVGSDNSGRSEVNVNDDEVPE